MADTISPVQENFSRHLTSPRLLQIAFIAVLLCALYLISTVNYLLFHGIIEIAGLAVAFSIFIIVWNTRREITDGFFLIIGISFLFFGSIDLVHTLAYKGMGIFPGNSSDLPTQLWIAARYFQSITFLIATLFIGRSVTRDRKYDAAIIIGACTTACVLIFASIFVWQNFPHCFIEGSGLTPFKIGSEYVISLILIATIVILYRKREHFDPAVWQLLIAAQVFLVLGELAFTSYVSVFGFMNMLGHLFRLMSVYLFYRVFVVIALTRPYDLLLRELRVNEDRVCESEERFRTMIEQSPLSIQILSPDGQTVQVNHTFEELWGVTLGDLKGYNILQDPQLTRLGIMSPIQRGFSGEVGIIPAVQYDTRDSVGVGEKRWVLGHIYPVRDTRGTIRNVILVHEDITERTLAEDALRESEKKYRTLFESMLEGFAYCQMIYDEDGRPADWVYLEVNAAFERLTGLKNIAGKRVLEVFPDIRTLTPEIFDTYGRVTSTGLPETFEIDFKPLKMWMKVSAFSLKENHFVAVFEDITERKRAEEALRQANHKLNLLSSITRHDINNQLFSLKAFLELSKESLNDPAKMSEYIIKEERAANAIERQIVFTREYQDLGVKAPVWQDVESSISKALTVLPMREIRVIAEVNNLHVYADPLFERVFYNLIDNALRYGGQEMTRIRITTKESEKGLAIIFEDDGAGISPDDKKRLFERGFGKHTGLGLFLSREILAITGITITETSEPGKGARFEITVPVGAWRVRSENNSVLT